MIIPILLGFFSVGGLCIVLLFGRLNNSRISVQTNDTSTPFEYVYLGTEPGIFEPTLEETEPPAVTETPLEDDAPRPPLSTQVVVTSLSTNTPASFFPTNTPLRTFTPTTFVVNTATRTPTSASTAPLNPGTYDDTDSRLVYGGNWDTQNNVSGAERGTLHVSNNSTLSNSITFRFIGTEVRLFYQSGSGLGTLRVNIDGQNFDLDQSDDPTEWVSIPFVNGTHTVTITHISGGSANLDYVIVPDLVLTSTPEP